MRRISFKNTVSIIQFVILVILIGAAIYVSIGRLVLSFSDVYRDDFIRWMEQKLNMDVNIGAIEGNWIYFDPEISLDQVALGESLYFDHLTLRIDTFKSLLNRRVVVTAIKLKSIELHIEEAIPGKWNAVGFSEPLESFDLDLGLEFLHYLNAARVDDMVINLITARGDYVLSISNLVLKSEGKDERRISVPLKILGKNAKTYGSINLLGKYKGTLKKSDFKGDFYAKIFGSDLEHLIDLAHFSHQFSDVSIDNEVWLSTDSDHTSTVSYTHLTLPTNREV